MIVATPIKTEKTYYTPDEYLELESKSDIKHEYLNGEIIPKIGLTTNHNKLEGKIASKLLISLEDQDYEIYISSVRLWIEEYNYYAYPDVMVVKGKSIYEGKGQTTIINPTLIIEVLSKSTADYDQGDKFDVYRSLSSFKEYILISQTAYYVKQFAKNEQGKWVLTDYRGESAILKLESLDFEISFKELYKNIDFNESED